MDDGTKEWVGEILEDSADFANGSFCESELCSLLIPVGGAHPIARARQTTIARLAKCFIP